MWASKVRRGTRESNEPNQQKIVGLARRKTHRGGFSPEDNRLNDLFLRADNSIRLAPSPATKANAQSDGGKRVRWNRPVTLTTPDWDENPTCRRNLCDTLKKAEAVTVPVPVDMAPDFRVT